MATWYRCRDCGVVYAHWSGLSGCSARELRSPVHLGEAQDACDGCMRRTRRDHAEWCPAVETEALRAQLEKARIALDDIATVAVSGSREERMAIAALREMTGEGSDG